MTTALEIAGFSDISLLKRGGFATVYRAREVATGRVVALKVLDRTGQVEEARFDRERDSLKLLADQPETVGVSGGGRAPDGSPYLVLEYLAGGSLDAVVTGEGKLSPTDAAWIGDKMLAALAFAHSAGVLHRDVKPSNILLGNGTAKLADFGIAKFNDATNTTASAVAQTVSFAAPEVLRGEAATPSSDLYSLGATLYNLVTGRPLTASWQEAMGAALGGKPLAVDLSAIPEALATTIDALLQPDPSARPTSAETVRAQVASLVPTAPSAVLARFVNARTEQPAGTPKGIPTPAPAPDMTAFVTVARTAGALPEQPTSTYPKPAPVPHRPVRTSSKRIPLLAGGALAALALLVGVIYVAGRGPEKTGGSGTTQAGGTAVPLTTGGVATTVGGGGVATTAGGGGDTTAKAKPKVPRLEGATEREAKSQLTALGITATVEKSPVGYGDQRTGKVLSSVPGEGTEVPSGAVTIRVAYQPALNVNFHEVRLKPAGSTGAPKCGEPDQASGAEVYFSGLTVNGAAANLPASARVVASNGIVEVWKSPTLQGFSVLLSQDDEGNFPDLVVNGEIRDSDDGGSATLFDVLGRFNNVRVPVPTDFDGDGDGDGPIAVIPTDIFGGRNGSDGVSRRCDSVVLTLWAKKVG